MPPQPFVEWCARMDVTSLRTIRSTVVTREHVAIYIPVAYSLQITKRAACCTRNCTTPADLHTPKTGERREIIETLSRQFSPANDEVLVGSCSFRHRAQFRSLHRMFRKRSPKLYGCVPRSPLNRRRSYTHAMYARLNTISLLLSCRYLATRSFLRMEYPCFTFPLVRWNLDDTRSQIEQIEIFVLLLCACPVLFLESSETSLTLFCYTIFIAIVSVDVS